MRILILGGSGFVSGTLARKAVSLDHSVWTVTRGLRDIPVGVTKLTIDRKDHDGFAKTIGDAGQEWDLVVDCIGFDERDARQDISVLLPRAASFVFISTDFVYDPRARSVPQKEEPAMYRTDGYGGKKRSAEAQFIEHTQHSRWTILRPCHIYGPGSLLGCLPEHGRDPDLIEHIKNRVPLRLVEEGRYLQQPIYCEDLVDVILSCAHNTDARGRTCNVSGPDVVASHEYYSIIADILDCPISFESVSASQFLSENPDRDSFLCDRVYSTDSLEKAGLAIPATPIRKGLERHVMSLLS